MWRLVNTYLHSNVDCQLLVLSMSGWHHVCTLLSPIPTHQRTPAARDLVLQKKVGYFFVLPSCFWNIFTCCCCFCYCCFKLFIVFFKHSQRSWWKLCLSPLYEKARRPIHHPRINDTTGWRHCKPWASDVVGLWARGTMSCQYYHIGNKSFSNSFLRPLTPHPLARVPKTHALFRHWSEGVFFFFGKRGRAGGYNFISNFTSIHLYFF